MTYPNIVPSGEDIIPYTSGASNLGNPNQYFDKIYVNSVVQTGVGIDPTLFVSTTGGSMYGNLNMTSGSQITGIGLTLSALEGSDLTLAAGKDVVVSAVGVGSISGSAGLTLNSSTGTLALTGSGQLSVSSFNNMSVTASGSGQMAALNGLYLSGNGSNVNLNAGISLNAGTGNIATPNSILPTSSGTQDIGSPSNYFGTVYANRVVQTGSTAIGSGITTDALARAWVNFGFNGTNILVSGSYNVSSITYNTTGFWTVNFLTAMPSKNYTIIAAPTDFTAGCNIISVGSTKATGSVQLVCNNAVNTKFNPLGVSANFFGQ